MVEVVKSATFERWLCKLKDRRATARVLVEIDRLVAGKLVEGSVIQGWKAALGELSLVYPDRINAYL